MNLLDQMAEHIREFQRSGEGMGALYRDLENYDRLQESAEAVAILTVRSDWGPRIDIDAENAISKLPPGEYPLYIHAPADRVQPERGEAVPRCDDPECGCKEPTFTEPMEAIEFLAGRMEFAGVAEGVAKSYARDLRAILDRTAPAPPTDASGGVTDAMTQAACDKYHECGPFDSEYPSFVRMRAALEAVDRARKQTPVATQPVDASARAASAGEPVACGWKVVPLEPTAEMIAAAAAAVWPTAVSEDDLELARKAARILCMTSMQLAPGATIDSVAAGIATMATAYRNLLANAPTAPTPVAAYREVTIEDATAVRRKYVLGMSDVSLDANVAMLDAIQHIGAVIRTTDAPSKDREPPHCPTCDCGPK